ncbi:efflux RND transporter periplasmic adaptor subunit [Pseudophaeobacter sp. EL27]|uniref:efflux RND transporter periplasmic adaptor subunit n=1 Tax=Pseudophaeobacter sp. EL27 TaxID=2107580 RepID=UPI0013C50BEF|nr:HlyD family efflux transporter periplasmic adaptor subunit [Pseudophaeobacter sp. EL27]
MNLRPFLVLPPLAVGILGFVWMTSRPEPQVSTPPEAELAVRVQPVVRREIIASAEGFGRVEAEHSWTAISEVEGRVLAVSSGLNTGSIVGAGTILVEIDQTDNELSRQKTLANISAVEADLAELAREEENAERLLLVEQRIFKVAEAELARVKSLLERGAGTQATVDTAEKSYLAQQTSVTNLTNTLSLFPAKRDALLATQAVRQAELAEADRALEKSTITAPFRGRVASKSIEVGQFVRTGDTLLSLDSTAAAEVTAEVQPSSFGPVVFSGPKNTFLQSSSFDTSQFIEALQRAGVSAHVELPTLEQFAPWEAEVVRLRGTMDADTGTMGIVVRVADPLVAQQGLRRPPLHTGSFVRVVFSSAPRPDSIAVPRHALHVSDEGKPFVYLADKDDRLAIREVVPGEVVGGDVIIQSGLSGGETLVLGLPSPPVAGMKLAPVPVAAAAEGN